MHPIFDRKLYEIKNGNNKNEKRYIEFQYKNYNYIDESFQV